MKEHPQEYILGHSNIATITIQDLLRHSAEPINTDSKGFFEIQPESIEIDFGLFGNPYTSIAFPKVSVSQMSDAIVLSCPCNAPKRKLCEHQAQVLYNIRLVAVGGCSARNGPF